MNRVGTRLRLGEIVKCNSLAVCRCGSLSSLLFHNLQSDSLQATFQKRLHFLFPRRPFLFNDGEREQILKESKLPVIVILQIPSIFVYRRLAVIICNFIEREAEPLAGQSALGLTRTR